MSTADHRLTQLRTLEAESVHVMREVAAELEPPVLLFGGKDSVVMLELARTAFAPARIPFPVMHVDTGLDIPEVLAFATARVAELGVELVVASVPDAIAAGTVKQEPTGSRNRIQTPVLLDAVERDGFTALFGAPAGTRTRPGPRTGCSAAATSSASGPREPAPRALRSLQRPDSPGRVDPGPPAVELDRAGRGDPADRARCHPRGRRGQRRRRGGPQEGGLLLMARVQTARVLTATRSDRPRP